MVVGEAVIGALRVQKGGVGRGVLRQRRADQAVLDQDIPGGGECVRPLPQQAGSGERRLSHGVLHRHRGIIPQFVGRVKIFRRSTGIFHRHGVDGVQQLRRGGAGCRRQLGQGAEAVLMQPVERIGALRQRGAVQRRPAAVGIRLPHEAAKVVGRGDGHGDGEHRRLRPGGRGGGEVAARQAGGGVIAIAQGVHALRDGGPAALQPPGAGGVAVPAVQHRHGQQHEQSGAAPDPQGGVSLPAEGQQVQEKQGQRGQRHPPQRGGRGQHHGGGSQRQRRQAQGERPGTQGAAGAPQAPEGGEHRQQRREPRVVRGRGEGGIDAGEHLLPCVERGVDQRGKSAGEDAAPRQQDGGAQSRPAQGRQPRAAAFRKGRRCPGGQHRQQQRQPQGCGQVQQARQQRRKGHGQQSGGDDTAQSIRAQGSVPPFHAAPPG